MPRRLPALLLVPVLILLLAAPTASAAGRSQAGVYHRTKLVSDQPGLPTQDTNLVNAWGLAAGSGTPWWVADNGTNLSTLYDGTGARQGLVVSVPVAPTGVVFNGSSQFVVTDGTNSGPALFIFSTEAGTILGWSPGVPPPPPSTQAQPAADRSDVGASYKGLAIDPEAGRLYATDFHNARVDVFDSSFGLVTNLPAGAFTDPKIPAHFAPFGIQDIGGTLFVTYAKQDADAHDDVHGTGLGFVDAYDTNGMLLGRVATRGLLNAPWGLAMAPAEGFGRFSGDLLVGNFGNGQINAFAERPNGSWSHRGRLRVASNKPLTVDGLWALQFGMGPRSGSPNTLFFTAGPDDESHGLFGTIEAGAS